MARFLQLDRLADQEEWLDYKRGQRTPWRRRHRGPTHRTLPLPLDELITGDGVLPGTKDDC
jgi:hypothetical protein